MRVVLFTGKGGVGKTTLAAATAAHLARTGRKSLAVSTDPAHSLGDALGADLDAEPTEVDEGLYAAHVDARGLVDGAWAGMQRHLQTMLAGAGVDELVADEVTVLPGVEELLALSTVREYAETGPWEVVIVDCGPTAETLRLLGLPEAVSGYLRRLFPAHRRAVRNLVAGLAGVGDAGQRWDDLAAAVDELAARLTDLRGLLADPTRTSIRLVLTPERVVAAETRRTLTALALHGLCVDGLVVNRLLPVPPASLRGPVARWLRERSAAQQAVLDQLAELGVPLRTADCAAVEPIGVPALRELGQSVYGAEDPLAGATPTPWLTVRRTAGSGTDLDSEFELVLRLPGVTDEAVDLARVGDELAVTVGAVRRLVALPSVLRRCTVTGARVDETHGGELVVVFRPDPSVWMR